MIRISRVVAKDKVLDLLKLPNVSVVSIKKNKQNYKNPAICKVYIYLIIDKDNLMFGRLVTKLIEYSKKYKDSPAGITAKWGKIRRFIKESAFDKFDYPMPKEYRELCDKYSQTFFDEFNRSSD